MNFLENMYFYRHFIFNYQWDTKKLVVLGQSCGVWKTFAVTAVLVFGSIEIVKVEMLAALSCGTNPFFFSLAMKTQILNSSNK